jgi:hypothetical protein
VVAVFAYDMPANIGGGDAIVVREQEPVAGRVQVGADSVDAVVVGVLADDPRHEVHRVGSDQHDPRMAVHKVAGDVAHERRVHGGAAHAHVRLIGVGEAGAYGDHEGVAGGEVARQARPRPCGGAERGPHVVQVGGERVGLLERAGGDEDVGGEAGGDERARDGLADRASAEHSHRAERAHNDVSAHGEITACKVRASADSHTLAVRCRSSAVTASCTTVATSRGCRATAAPWRGSGRSSGAVR